MRGSELTVVKASTFRDRVNSVLLSATVRCELAGTHVPELPPRSFKLLLARAFAPALKDSLMFILRALAFFFLTQAVLAQQPTPNSSRSEADTR